MASPQRGTGCSDQRIRPHLRPGCAASGPDSTWNCS